MDAAGYPYLPKVPHLHVNNPLAKAKCEALVNILIVY